MQLSVSIRFDLCSMYAGIASTVSNVLKAGMSGACSLTMSHPEFLRNASTIEKALKSEVFPNLGGGNSQEPGECHPKDD